jgi:hypothetical protein
MRPFHAKALQILSAKPNISNEILYTNKPNISVFESNFGFFILLYCLPHPAVAGPKESGFQTNTFDTNSFINSAQQRISSGGA